MRLKKSLALLLALVMLLGMLPVSALATEPAVAQIDDVEFETLASALEYAADNFSEDEECTITILDSWPEEFTDGYIGFRIGNNSDNSEFYIKNLIVDLNGFGSDGSENVNLSIEVYDGCTVTITNGTLDGNASVEGNGNLIIDKSATITIGDVALNGTGTITINGAVDQVNISGGGVVTIGEGASVNADRTYDTAVEMASDSGNAKLFITDGTLYGRVFAADKDEVHISGGTIVGSDVYYDGRKIALSIYSGKLDISGGKIDGIAEILTDSAEPAANVTITGGTIGALDVDDSIDGDLPVVAISGGTFVDDSGLKEDYIKSGYQATEIGDKTIVWKPGDKNVTFKVVNGAWDDGNDEDITEVAVYEDATLPTLTEDQIPAVGSKPGVGFEAGSWDVTPNIDTAITEDTIYTYTYAAKDSISRTVTFKVENGSWDDETTDDKPVTLTGYEGDELTLSAEQIPVVGTKPEDGFVAGSWDKEPDTAYVITEDTTYTYTYSKVYKILYDLDGGTNDADNPTTFVAADRPVPINDPVKEHYTFEGWSTGTNPGGRYKNLKIKSALWDVELTAHWKPVEYEITYYLDKGTNAETNPETYTIESDDITLDEPTKTGWDFAGWTGTGLTGATREVKIEKGSTGAREYWATWTVGEYELSSEAEHATVAFTVDGTAKATAKMDDDVVVTVTPDTGYTVNTVAYYVGEDTEHAYALTADADTGAYTFTMPADNVTVKVTLNAPATYTVNLVTNGGKINAGNVTGYTYGVGATLPTDVTKDYYEFAGWYRYQNPYKDPVTEITATDQGNATYYAKWTPVKYTINYVLNGGTNANPAYYTCEDTTITLADPNRDGYTFIGWTGEDEYTPTKNITIPAGSHGEKTFTANWVKSSYRITVTLNNPNVGTASVDNPYATTGDTVTVTATPNPGYKVKQIKVNNTPITGTSFTMPGTAVEVFVEFEVVTYTVKFDANGGEGDAMDDQIFTVENVSDTLLSANTFTKTGNSFAGWATAAEGAVVYADEAPLNTVALPTAEDGTEINLFAVWTADSYSVWTDVDPADSGSLTVSKNAAAIGEEIEVTVTPATGYELDKLEVYPRDSAPIDITEARSFEMPAADVTVKATFKKVGYTATLFSAGGAYEGSLPDYMVESDNGLDYVINYNIGDKKPLPTAENFKKTGYAGPVWYDNANRTGTAYTEIPEDAAGNMNFYAKWTANQYYAVFDANGAVFSDGKATKQLIVTYDGTYELPEVNRSGYTFEGWFTEKDGGTEITADSKVDILDTTTFYAHWTAGEGEIQKMLTDAATHRYDDYSYYGAFIPNGFSVDYYIQQSVLGEDSVNVMNDMARYLGGLYRNAGAKATKLVYNGVEYTWVPETGLLGSNWTNGAGKTLVSALTDAFKGNSLKVGQPFTITVDGQDVAFTFYCQNYVDGAPEIGVAPAALVVSKATDAEKSAYNAPDGYNVVELYHIDVYINNVLQTGSVTLKEEVTLRLPLSATPATVKAVHGNDKTPIDAKIAEGNAEFAAKNFSDYAIVTPATYNVTLHWHGGTGGDANVTVTYGEAMPEIQVPAKDGYVFAGYYEKEDGQGTKYYKVNGTSMTTWDKTADATLHAYWTAKSYNVETKATPEIGGTITGTEATADCGSIVTFKVEAKTGYALDTATLKVWAGNEELTVYGNHDGSFYFTMPAADVTIEAGFTADTYTVTYNANGGNGTMAQQTFTRDVTQALTPNAFTREGYQFLGWAMDATATAYVWGDRGEVSVSADTTLYAVWQADSHTISARITPADGGEVAYTASADTGAAISFTVTAKDGYTIGGVVVRNAVTDAVIEPVIKSDDTYNFTMPAADVRIDAVFTATQAAAPIITKQPENLTYAYGTDADTLYVVVERPADGAALTYQWYSSNADASQYMPLNAEEGVELSVDGLPVGEYFYFCKVTATLPNGTKAEANTRVAAVIVTEAQPTLNPAPTAKDRVYDGKEETLVTAGEAENGTLMYRFKTANGEFSAFSPAVPVATDAGVYKVQYYVVGDAPNYTDTAVQTLTVTVSRAPLELELSMGDYEYGATVLPQPELTGNEGNGSVFYAYRLRSATAFAPWSEYTTTESLPADLYDLRATVAETANYESGEAITSFEVKALEMVITAYGYEGVFDGQPHGITLAGVPEGATVKYSRTEGPYTLDELTFTDAGVYTVYYQVTKDNYYTVTDDATVTITRATMGANAYTVTMDGYDYGEQPSMPELAPDYAGGGTVTYYYSKAGGMESKWIISAPPTLDAGDYAIYATIEGDPNYKNFTTAPTNFTVSKVAPTVTAWPFANNRAYDGTEKALLNPGTVDGGKFEYRLAENAVFSEDIPTATNAGTYTVFFRVAGDDNHTEGAAGSLDVTIYRKDIAETAIVFEDAIKFTGATVTQEDLAITDGAYTLTQDTDYTVAYKNNYNVGTASFTVTGKGNYTGDVTKEFFIIPLDVNDLENRIKIEVLPAKKNYTGEKVFPALVKVTDTGTSRIISSDNYDIYYLNNVDAGDATVVIIGKAGTEYENMYATAPFTIEPLFIAPTVTLDPVSFDYDGTPKKPTVTVKDGSEVIPATQYTVEYSYNIEPDTAVTKPTVTIKAKVGGNYAFDDVIEYFTIKPQQINANEIEILVTGTYIYNAAPQIPTITVQYHGVIIPANEYIVTYDDNVNAGEHTLTVQDAPGGANWINNGTKTAKFMILPHNIADTAFVTLDAIADQTYIGSQITPEVTGTYADTFELVLDTDFEVAYGKNLNVADGGTVTVTGKGNFTGTKTLSFNILPKGLKTAGISAKLNYTETLYNGTVKEPVPTVTYTPTGAAAPITLEDGVDYTFVRDTAVEVGTYTVTVTGQGNYKGKIELSFEILPASFKSLTLSPESAIYTSTDLTPEITVKAGLLNIQEDVIVPVSEYKVVWTKDGNEVAEIVEAGTYTVTVTAKKNGNYVGSELTADFIVEKKDIGDEETVTVTYSWPALRSDVYTGYAKEPVPTVVYKPDETTEVTLTRGSHYTVAYEDNVNAGAMKMVLTADEKNYTGKRTIEIEIVPATVTVNWGNLGPFTFDGTEHKPTARATVTNTNYVPQPELVVNVVKKDDDTVTESVNAGTYIATVAFNEADAVNYAFADGATLSQEFVINPASLSKVALKTIPSGDTVYNGQPKAVAYTVTDQNNNEVTTGFNAAWYSANESYNPSIPDANITFDMLDSTVDPTKLIDAGNYIFVVTAAEGGNYTGTVFAGFPITKATNNVTVQVAIDDWTYGDTPSTPTATFAFGEPVFKYAKLATVDPMELEPGAAYSSEVPTAVGDYAIIAVVEETNSFTGALSGPVAFKILPKSITITADDVSKTFGEADPALTYVVEPTDGIKVTLTRVSGENAGEYAINAYKLDADVAANYEIIKFNPGTFTIDKADLKDIKVTITGWASGSYSENTNAPKTNYTGDGKVTYEYKVKTAADSTYTTTVPKTVSATTDYVVRAKITETANYNAFTTEPTEFKVTYSGGGGFVPSGGGSSGGGSIGGGGSGLTIKLLPTTNGTANFEGKAASVTSMTMEQDKVYRIEVNPAANYKIDKVTYTTAPNYDNPAEATPLSDGLYQIIAKNASIEVTATFAPINNNDPSVGKITIGSYTNGAAVCNHGPSCPLNGFADLDPNGWYHDGIHYCLENGIMQGFGDEYFRPASITTRAQVVTTLWNIAGHPIATSPVVFSDVSYGDWYYDAVMWAAANGIVEGYGDGTFRPNQQITHEEMAKIFCGYAQFYGLYDESVKVDISGMPGYEKVSEWAVPFIQWAVGADICCGVNGNTSLIAAREKANRAELATFILNFCTKVAIKPAAQQ